MKDWTEIARGHGLEIPEAELARMAPVLDALEAAFRPLAAAIPEDVEPAVIFRPTEDA